MVGCTEDTRDSCSGTIELKVIQRTGPRKVFAATQNRGDTARALHTMTPAVEVSETDFKLMIVTGNCCWQFYER